MSESRFLTGWLLVGLVAVAGAVGAVLGVVQSPSPPPLHQAIANTLSASGYTQDITESTPQGNQSERFVYQSPDRLGGYIQSGNKRVYLYLIGKYEYQSAVVSTSATSSASSATPPAHLTFYRQASQSAKALDPARRYLSFPKQASNIHQAGATYSFTLTESGQTAQLTFTVAGTYVSQVYVEAGKTSVLLVLSDVGTSPDVALPPDARIVTS